MAEPYGITKKGPVEASNTDSFPCPPNTTFTALEVESFTIPSGAIGKPFDLSNQMIEEKILEVSDDYVAHQIVIDAAQLDDPILCEDTPPQKSVKPPKKPPRIDTVMLFEQILKMRYPSVIKFCKERNVVPASLLIDDRVIKSLFPSVSVCMCGKIFVSCLLRCVRNDLTLDKPDRIQKIIKIHEAIDDSEIVESISRIPKEDPVKSTAFISMIQTVFPNFPIKIIQQMSELIKPLLNIPAFVSKSLAKDTVLYGASVLSLLRQLWIAPTYEHIAHAVFNFGVISKMYFKVKIQDTKLGELTDLCLNQSMKWNGSATTQARNDGPSVMDEPEEWRLIYNRLLESDFVCTLRTMLVNMVAYRCFTKEVARKVCAYVGAPKRKIPVIDVIPVFMESIIKLVQFGEAVMRGEPLHEIFFAKDTVSEAIEEARTLLLYKDRLYTGLKTPRGMCQLEYRRKAVELVELFETFEKDLSPFDGRLPKVKHSKEILQDEIARIEGKLNGETRRPPIAICLHGAPGIGKSQLIQIAPRVYAAMRGWDYTDSLIFSRDRQSVYWEGYQPFSNPFIHYSEVGNEAVDVVRTKGSQTLVEINSLIDACRFQCNMAFDDKGKVFATPEMVLIDTNNSDMHAKTTMSNPSAIFRRFIFVEAVVKKEFKLPQSTSLDVEKSLRVGGNLLDRYHFSVYTRIPNGPRHSTIKFLLQEGTLDELIALYAKLFTAHLSNASKLEEFNLDAYVRAKLGDAIASVPSGPDQVQDKIEAAANVVMPKIDLSNLTVEAEEFDEFDEDFYEPEVSAYDIMNQASGYMTKLSTTTLLWLLYTCAFYAGKTKMNKYSKHALWALPAVLTATLGLYGFAGFSALMWLCKNRFTSRLFFWNSADKISMLRKKNIVMYMLGLTSYNPSSAYTDITLWTGIALTLIGAWATTKILFNYFQPKDGTAEASQFREEDENNKAIYAHEDFMEARTTSVRYKNKLHASWGSAYLGNREYSFTGKGKDLLKCASRNVRKALVARKGTTNRAKTHVYGICENFAIINTHAFNEGDGLFFCPQGYESHLRQPVEVIKVKKLSNDKTLLQVNSQFKDIRKHLMDDHTILTNYEGFIDGTSHHCTFINEDFYFKPNTYITGAHVVFDLPHSVGMCGLPLVGQIASSGAVILGMHAAGSDNCDTGFVIPFEKTEIVDAIELMRRNDPFLSISSEAEFDEVRENHSNRSFFRYNEWPHIDDYGKLPGPVLIKGRSKLSRRDFRGISKFMKNDLSFERTEVYGKPIMMPTRIKGEYKDAAAIAVNKMNTPLVTLNRECLKYCIDELTDRIVSSQLKKKDFMPWSPVNMEDAINGVSHDAYFRSMNMNTASGYGYKGKKSAHFPITSEDDEIEYREPAPHMKQRLREILDLWSQGISVRFIIEGQYKDEPRLMEKVLAGKTRIFYITPQELLVLTRMLLARFYTCMVDDSDVFCVALGFDMHLMGHEMVTVLNEFCNGTDEILWDEPCILEGDYGGFDVSNPFPIAHAAATVVYNTCKRLGYNRQALLLLRMLLSENLYPNITIYKDLFCKPGMQPSGKYGTAEDNSLRGLLLLMYAWYSHPKLEKKPFFENVRPYIYGDDVIAGVKKGCRKFFNNKYYQEFVENNYGMTFTSALKSSDMEPFVTLRTMSFLRRTFCESAYEDVCIAQLNLNSIYKTLEWRLDSTCVSDVEQDESALQSLMWELFLHSNCFEHFDMMRTHLKDMFFDAHGFLPRLPRFDDIYQRIYGKNPERSDVEEEKDWSSYQITVESEFIRKLKRKRASPADEIKEFEAKQDVRDNLIDYQLELREVQSRVDAYEKDGVDFEFLLLSQYLSHNPQEKIDVSETLAIYQHMRDLECTVKTLKRIKNKRWKATVESDFEMKESGNDPVSVIENLTDVGGDQTVKAPVGESKYLDIGQYEKMSIDKFFSRPVEISNFDITVGTDVFSQFSIWDLYTKNPTVRAKLRNYAYFKADLVVRIVISGSPFHYGKILVSYQPLAPANDNLTYHHANLTGDVGTRPLFLNYLSQARGAIVMDVKANRPIEMRCPFILPKPMMNLHNESSLVVSSSTSFVDAANAGDLYFASINTIKSASATPTAVGVQILCHAENVSLGCISATQLEITTESEEYKEDERVTGPIEKYSSKMAQFSHALSVVPQIRPLALASGMVFQGVSDVAALLGFSKPQIVEDVSFVKNRPWGNSAVTIGCSTSERISLDPKQELTVDPRVTGITTDDMSLKEVYGRKSYLTSFTWSTSDVALADSIFLCKVSPQMDTCYEGLTRRYFQPSALSYVQSLFKWWHGEIEYHIEVVASAYHRGKLAVYYEPNCYQGAIIDADISLNKNFIHVIDLQETQDFRFCVKWAQSEGFLVCERPGYGRYHHGADFSFTAAPYAANGYFGVVPYTTLQSPDGSSVEVNVYVRGIDMVFGFMSSDNLPTQRYAVGFVESEFFVEDHEVECTELNPTTDDMKELGFYYFGEVPTSFRSLLKRFTRSYSLSHTATIDAYLVTFNRRIYETPYPAYNDTTVHVHSLFRYLSYAYVGYKGSRRHRVRMFNVTNGINSDGGAMAGAIASLGDSDTSTTLGVSVAHAHTKMRGSIMFISNTNGGVEFETPFYSRNLFSTSFNADMENNILEDTSWIKSFVVSADILSTIGDNVACVHDTASGEDFSFLRFNGAPFYTTAL